MIYIIIPINFQDLLKFFHLTTTIKHYPIQFYKELLTNIIGIQHYQTIFLYHFIIKDKI